MEPREPIRGLATSNAPTKARSGWLSRWGNSSKPLRGSSELSFHYAQCQRGGKGGPTGVRPGPRLRPGEQAEVEQPAQVESGHPVMQPLLPRRCSAACGSGPWGRSARRSRRARCATSKTGRALHLHLHLYDDLLRHARRQWAADEDLRQSYRQHRPMVEAGTRCKRRRR
jgi:hypothetical protein